MRCCVCNRPADVFGEVDARADTPRYFCDAHVPAGALVVPVRPSG
jgi:hypothetical protein